jgi:hypothetical protein
MVGYRKRETRKDGEGGILDCSNFQVSTRENERENCNGTSVCCQRKRGECDLEVFQKKKKKKDELIWFIRF